MHHSFYLGLFILMALIIVEVSCQVFWLPIYSPSIISWTYFISGLGIGAFFLWLSSRPKPAFVIARYQSILYFLFLLLGLYIYRHSAFALERNPLNYQVADMLPVIQIMGERFLQGEPIYATIPDIWGGMQPIYLPAMWLTYLPAVIFNFDLRWISLLLIGVVFLMVYFFVPARRQASFWIILFFLPVFMIINHLLTVDSVFFSASEEAVVVFYYLLFGASLFTRQYILQAVLLTFCLLSRFSLLGWVPVYFAVLYVQAGWPILRRVLAVSVILGVALMTLTGALFHLDIWLGIQKNYLDALMSQPWKYQELIDVNLGLAKMWQYDALPIMHYLSMLIGLILLPAIFIFFIFKKYRFTQHPLFLIGSLKITLVIFYNLLIMPYGYLFYTNTALSIILFMGYTAHLSTRSLVDSPSTLIT